MRKIPLAIALVAGLAFPAQATSIVDWEDDRIRDGLARIFVGAWRCNDAVIINHDAADLVWDVLQLKTGTDVNSDEAKEAMTPFIDAADAEAQANTAAFCGDLIARFSSDGSEIQSLVIPRD